MSLDCMLLYCHISIKIHDMLELKEVYAIIDIEEEKGMCQYVFTVFIWTLDCSTKYKGVRHMHV